MPIRVADRREWGGASSKIVKPIMAEDCVMAPCFACLVSQEAQPGRGCTVRAGVGWAKRSVEQIAETCTPPTPIITSTTPNPWVIGNPGSVYGSNFGPEPGLVVLKGGEWWGGPGVTYQQPVESWADGLIKVSAVVGVSPPVLWWLFVFTKWETHNDPGRGQGLVP